MVQSQQAAELTQPIQKEKHLCIKRGEKLTLFSKIFDLQLAVGPDNCRIDLMKWLQNLLAVGILT
jgi:hypothetical protein